ncbi:hypothetical protein AESSP_01585 [Aestuariimicrobium sp. T2.26MG-19.2B]|nr:hypothetical protein AESSP_01585 [Aestuariimicrobium sp. T2.26MG-19.2B]
MTFRRLLDERGIGPVSITSAGVAATDGQRLDSTVASLLAGDGIDVTGFASRRLEDDDVMSADLILTATRQHRSSVVQRVPRVLGRTFTLLEFTTLAANLACGSLPKGPDRLLWLRDQAAAHRNLLLLPDLPMDLPDPYMRRRAVYRASHRQIGEALETLADLLGAAR